MNGNKSVTANFEIQFFALNVFVVGSGTVVKTPDAATYPQGTSVSLQANPASGWSFVGWSGNVSGVDNPIDITMNGVRNVTATFTDMQPPAVVVVAPNGGETLEAGSHTDIKWTATDNSGSVKSVDLYVSRDEGKTFDLIQADVPNTGSFDWVVTSPKTSADALFKVVAKDAASNETQDVSDAVVALHNRTLQLAFGVTRIDEAVKAFELGTVAPNPASGPLRVDFSVAKESPVRLELLDVQGRQMATLADGTYPAGRYQVRWDGSGHGGPVPAGMYFVRYQAAGLRFTKRVVITR
jgi:hypothetical protein